MASQSSLDDIATPIEIPSTPQPRNAELVAAQEILARASPPTSMIAADGSSVFYNDLESQFPNKLSPPRQLSSSITPPPSSQQRHTIAATPPRAFTPLSHALSSPPPTVMNGVKRETSGVTELAKLTPQQIASFSHGELVEKLLAAICDISRLEVTAGEARMNVAHWKLQHNLLTIETEENTKRMDVEHQITQREVDILRSSHQARDSISPNEAYMAKVKAHCDSLVEEINALNRRLKKAKKVIGMKEDEISTLQEERQRLLSRIRENREHLNFLRGPGGLFHPSTPRPSPSTPLHVRNTPKQTPAPNRSTNQPRHLDPIDFLLSVAARDSAPSTPVASRRPGPHTPSRHVRGVQSLSSLPTTPYSTGVSTTPAYTLLPSAQFARESETRYIDNITQPTSHNSRQRRRKSRDSTISASDAEDIARANMNSFREESEEILESQASQNAAEILRLDPRESFEVVASRTTTPTPTGPNSNLTQTKIFGAVTKPVGDKRKRSDEYRGVDISPKKMKVNGGIGLGIGFDARG